MGAGKLLAAVVVAGAAVGGYAVWSMAAPMPLIVQGEVEATRIDIAPRVPGRVGEVLVDFGDRVTKGQVLVLLESQQLTTQLATSKAALAVAEANRDMTYATQPEAIAARKAELAKADADVVLAQKTYDRIAELRQRAVASVQDLDEASNSLNAALRGQEAAAANYRQAEKGNSPEQKAVSQAQAEEAKASYDQTAADVAELTIYAPIDGQVTARMAEPGKTFGAGSPVLSVVDVENSWFTFNLREDFLDGLAVGDPIAVHIPALDGKTVPAKVTAINVQGTYANWRATKATGDFDLRTFSIRAVPEAQDPELRPGMTALIDLDRR